MAYKMDSSFSSHWAGIDPLMTSNFSSDSSLASSGTSFGRRYSIVSSSSDSWGECPLSAGSTIMTPSSMPSTPSHDERTGNIFWRQYPHMLSSGTEAKDSRQTLLDCSPMVPHDSPLGRLHFDSSFSDDDGLPGMTPSPLALRMAHLTPRGVRRGVPNILMSPHDGMIKPELMTPFSVMSGHDDRYIDAHFSGLRPIHTCHTVVPSSIVTDPMESPFESDYFPSSPGQPFSTSAALLSQFGNDDHDIQILPKSPSPSPMLDPDWDPMGEDDLFIARSSSTSRKVKRDPKTLTKSQTGIKKKQLKRLGSHFIKGNLRGMADSIPVITEPSKTRMCTEPGCHAKFNRKEHLRRHIRIHEHTKPYPCALPDDVCSKSFGRTDNRTQHHATHLKVKPRNKPVSRAFLYECIRRQEDDPEKAEKAIAKLELRMQQDELDRPYRDMKFESDD